MQFLAEIDSSGLHTELRTEAAGLLKVFQDPRCRINAVMVHKIQKSVTGWKNRPLHWSDGCEKCFGLLGEAQEWLGVSNHLGTVCHRRPTWRIRNSSSSAKYVVDVTVGQHERGSEAECKRLLFCTPDSFIGEANRRFNEQNSQLVEVPMTQIVPTWKCRRCNHCWSSTQLWWNLFDALFLLYLPAALLWVSLHHASPDYCTYPWSDFRRICPQRHVRTPFHH